MKIEKNLEITRSSITQITRQTKLSESFLKFIWSVFLIFNSIYIYGYNEIRYILTLFLFLATIILLTRKGFAVKKSMFSGYLLFLLISIFYLFIGTQEWGFKLAESDSRTFIIYPILYMTILLVNYKISYIEKTVAIISICVPVIIFLKIIQALLGITQYQIFPSIELFLYNNHTAYLISTAQSLSFLPAFSTVMFFEERIKRWKFFYLSVSVLCLVDAIMVNRRAFILFFMISIFVYFLDNTKFKILIKKGFQFLLFISLLIILFIFILPLFDIDFRGFTWYMKNTFFIDYGSDTIRLAQFNILKEMWIVKPLFGWGFGAYAKDFVRDINKPYSYELTYVAYLMKLGIVGLFFYAFIIFRLMSKCHKQWRISGKAFYKACFYGVLSLLFCNFTNPYINVGTIGFVMLLLVVTKAKGSNER